MRVKTFGAKGVESISYGGLKPFQWRGEYRLYLWRPNNRAVHVDKRDIPTLIEEVGIENLGGKRLDAYKAKKEQEQAEKSASKPKPKSKPKKKEPEKFVEETELEKIEEPKPEAEPEKEAVEANGKEE